MMKRAVFAIAAFVSLATAWNGLAGELAPIVISNEFADIDEVGLARTFAMDRSDVFGTLPAADLIQGLPELALMDGRHLPVDGTLARVAAVPMNVFPLTFATVTAVPKPSHFVATDYKDAPVSMTSNRGKVYDMGGEVGMFYGRSVGGGRRGGGDDYGAYIVGGIGNDKVQITAGVSYEETNFRYSRARP